MERFRDPRTAWNPAVKLINVNFNPSLAEVFLDSINQDLVRFDSISLVVCFERNFGGK